MDEIVLANGVRVPALGLGTWQLREREMVRTVIRTAAELGYRLIDTAAAYSNEISIGKALTDVPLRREELFISDKVWNTCRGYDKVREACRASLKKLKTDYLDLYLVHWPASPRLYPDWEEQNADTWRGMESLYREGLVRSIGVCNFKPHHLAALQKTAQVLPMVDQFEFHPGMPQRESIGYCRQNGIAMMASSPLGNGQILGDDVLLRLAAAKKKSSAQICLRYALDSGFIVLPKASSPQRLAENISVFDFTLEPQEKQMLEAMPWCGGLAIDPDETEEFG